MKGLEKCPRCGFVANVGWQHEPHCIGCYKCGWKWMETSDAQQELFYELDLSYIGDRYLFNSLSLRPEWYPPDRMVERSDGTRVVYGPKRTC